MVREYLETKEGRVLKLSCLSLLTLVEVLLGDSEVKKSDPVDISHTE